MKLNRRRMQTLLVFIILKEKHFEVEGKERITALKSKQKGTFCPQITKKKKKKLQPKITIVAESDRCEMQINQSHSVTGSCVSAQSPGYFVGS